MGEIWGTSLRGSFRPAQRRRLYFSSTMPKQSAGLLVYRVRDGALEVFLVHPGGPFWAKKDAGAWSIPKGEFETDEDPLAAAQREFTEETGMVIAGPFAALGSIRQSGGKTIHAFAAEADFDA